MDFKDYYIKPHGADFNGPLREMVEKIHYKHTSRSMKQREVFSLWYEDLLVGCAVFGDICSAKGEVLYGADTIELRRFVLVNEAPRNSESFFLSRCIKLLKKSGKYQRILTYADPNKGHEGTIYKATNFKYIGVEKYRQQILRIGRRDVSMRQVYQKSKLTGNYVESAVKYQEMKKQGLAKVIMTAPKHIYMYDLKG